ncbi:AAA family ATPase [Pedobacter sp. MC2016-05]|uniref:AAA family ATPase n=1 Tax=Pedobacter sp. MC2016-05 TaxID=2994474 RepID=UPI002248213A|nr:AAA family ATPase [Pedobacter sp. MC2016-05]MCX2476095.1 AAA family ATPase [Pedobacter sp. MC2016-05]
MLNNELKEFLSKENTATDFQTLLNKNGAFISVSNTTNKTFELGLDAIVASLTDIKTNLALFSAVNKYEEKSWRGLIASHISNVAAKTLGNTQTKLFFSALSKLIKWSNPQAVTSLKTDQFMSIDQESLDNAIDRLTKVIYEYTPSRPATPLQGTPENIIFYGPPGTGKTREINIKYLNGRSEDEKEFITFHQSYSYEEFVEGIKPQIGHTEKEIFSESVLRNFAHEVFRYFINLQGQDKILANSVLVDSKIGTTDYRAITLKKHFGTGKLFAEFPDAQTKESLTTSATQRYFSEDLDLEGRPHVYFSTQWHDLDSEKLSFGNLKKFVAEESNGDLKAIKQGTEFKLIQKLSLSSGISYEFADGMFYTACRKAAILAGYTSLDDCLADSLERRAGIFEKAIQDGKVFCFCIDEINRGNVASVFGELITLIETSKRLGGEEEMQVRLPYSKRLFGVPANLQLIGSMNTADRSITLLDSALRRRFTFYEIAPSAETLSFITIPNIDLKALLTILNRRVTYFLGKDLSIGHAYFLSGITVATPTKKDLLTIFLGRILPLLEEYFYNDFIKVRLVLGDLDKGSDSYTFYIRDKEGEASKLFRGYDVELDEKDIFVVNPRMYELLGKEEDEIDDEIFTKIYSA